MSTQLQERPARKTGGLVLHKKSTRVAKGVSFDPVELEEALAAKPKKERNGLGTVQIKNKEAAMGLISKLCRTMKDLDIFDEFDLPLSQMISRIRTLN